jgi:hypothetical protein
MAMSTNCIASRAASDVGRPELTLALIVKSNTVQFGACRQW